MNHGDDLPPTMIADPARQTISDASRAHSTGIVEEAEGLGRSPTQVKAICLLTHTEVCVQAALLPDGRGIYAGGCNNDDLHPIPTAVRDRLALGAA